MAAASHAAKHSAPGPYLGFALQPVRFCYHLLASPDGASVSLEFLDDVAIHYADGSVRLEQTKSALSQNPLSDWAEDFWKAFSNWVKAIEDGKVEVTASTFCLYVTPQKTPGTFARRFNDANSLAEAQAAIATVKDEFSKLAKAPKCAPHVSAFLGAPSAIQSEIVRRFSVDGDADPVEPIRRRLETPIQPNLVDDFCAHAIGAAKQKVERLLREKKVPVLNADEFKASFRAFVQKNLMPGYLGSFTSRPAKEDVETVLATRPTFIRQLELIACDADEQMRAVSDYLRTSADKAIWADRGLIYEESFREWDDDLIARHGAISGETSDLHTDKPAEVRGRLTYRRCVQLEPHLEGRAVPRHFVHGSLNWLAEVKRLGWHPDFKELLGDG